MYWKKFISSKKGKGTRNFWQWMEVYFGERSIGNPESIDESSGSFSFSTSAIYFWKGEGTRWFFENSKTGGDHLRNGEWTQQRPRFFVSCDGYLLKVQQKIETIDRALHRFETGWRNDRDFMQIRRKARRGGK